MNEPRIAPYPTTHEELRRAWESSQRMLAVAVCAAGGILVVSEKILQDPPRRIERTEAVNGAIILRAY